MIWGPAQPATSLGRQQLTQGGPWGDARFAELSPQKYYSMSAQDQWRQKRSELAVVVTRRELLAGAIAITGSTLVATASPLRSVTSEFKSATTILFWIGEPSNAENNFIPNHESYWDKDWQTSYGGVDDPEHRNGYWPAGFRPKENLFYVALPYGEFTDANGLKISTRRIPWYRLQRDVDCRD
jgi:hypothetical protein